jgi:phospholipid/cholesterol/gamma-HCH transport system substrate-binding protein
METRAHHVLIGLFTVLSLGAALLFALWLGKSSVDKEFLLYDVVFKEAVTGLSLGSAVQYSGIKVGDVSQLSLDPQDPRKVRARIRVGPETPIKQNTHARLAITGVTGNAIIQLYGGTPSSPTLATRNEQPSEIPADPSPLARLLANGEDLVGNINSLLINANRLFSDENLAHVGNTLQQLDQTTAVLAEQRDGIRQTLAQLGEASQQANLTLQRSATLAQKANSLVDEQGSAIFRRTEQAVAALERSSRSLERLLADNQNALTSGLQGVGDIGSAIAELRATLAVLRQSSRRLAENPGALLEREQNQEFEP